MSSPDNSPEVLAFRLDRMRRAPRNWATWIGAFTLINGLLMITQTDMVFLAGLVAPFMLGSGLAHLGAGATLLLMARAVPGSLWGPYVVLMLYAVDTVLSGVLGLWTGVLMHVVVFGFLGFAWMAKQGLEHMHREALAKQTNAAAAESNPIDSQNIGSERGNEVTVQP